MTVETTAVTKDIGDEENGKPGAGRARDVGPEASDLGDGAATASRVQCWRVLTALRPRHFPRQESRKATMGTNLFHKGDDDTCFAMRIIN